MSSKRSLWFVHEHISKHHTASAPQHMLEPPSTMTIRTDQHSAVDQGRCACGLRGLKLQADSQRPGLVAYTTSSCSQTPNDGAFVYSHLQCNERSSIAARV